jgi:hypothetical protein
VADHAAWRQVELRKAWSELTLASLAREIGAGEMPRLLQVRAELPWISYVRCQACQHCATVCRFARIDDLVGRCHCGEALQASPLGSHAVIPGADLQRCWQQSLATLGLGPGDSLAFLDDEHWVYFFHAEAGSTGLGQRR